MRLLSMLLLCVALGCESTPDADLPSAAPRAHLLPSPARSARATSAVEFAALAAGDVAHTTPERDAATPVDTLTPGEDPAHPAQREVIYTADLRIVVVSIEQATRSVQSLAEGLGGHLQQSDSRSVTVRVPAARFESALQRIAALGEVVDRSVTASDVSEEVLDLNIRLDNARKTRERLLAHLGRSQKIADTLKIEAELSRVSETIEQLEGKLRSMRSRIALSTIHVGWTAQTPMQTGITPALALPFRWIEELGDGLVAGQVEPRTREPRLLDFGPRFEPPPDFIRYYSSRDRVEALSADGLRIKVRRQPNHDRGALSFWRDLARESLVRARGLFVADERELSGDRALIAGTREVGGETLGYLLVLKRTGRQVYSFEAWGPAASFDAHREALEASAATLR